MRRVRNFTPRASSLPSTCWLVSRWSMTSRCGSAPETEPTATGLVEGERPAAAVEGRNDFGEEGYSGPQPPVGDPPHRYCFWVFAASAPLELAAGASAEDLRRALEGGELASGTLVGTYQR